jgi:hypothetical protein
MMAENAFYFRIAVCAALLLWRHFNEVSKLKELSWL